MVLGLHVRAMAKEHLPPSPLRDPERLAAALLRPQHAAYYGEADLIEQTVMLAIAVAQAQAFLDGNKRTALAAMDTFLRWNRLHCESAPLELARRIEAVADPNPAGRAQAEDELEQWVRQHSHWL